MASYQTLRLWSARVPRALSAFVAGLALTAVILLASALLQPARVVPAFVTHELGAASSSAKQPQSLASSGLHATVSRQGFTASDGRSKWLTLTNAAAPSADWSYFRHGVARQTSFGTQTIAVTPGSVEEFDTVVAHHGVKTWRWHLGSPNLNPYLSPDGSVSFRSGGKRVGLHVLPAQVFDASGNAVTPSGARWSLRREKGGWLLELRLDDSTLPVPYTIDPSVSSVTFAGSPQTGGARSTWTVGFTTSSTGTLASGSTITVVFNPGFTVPATPAVTVGPAFANCTAAAGAVGQTVTITLGGGSCAVAPSTPATLRLAGLTNPGAGSLAANTFSVKTSVDSTSAINPGSPVVIAAATTPTAVTFASTTLAAAARGTWTVGFSSTSTGALHAGDTVTVVFPNATSVFSVPATPTVLLTKGFANCSAAATGASQTVTITLADNGGTCSLPNSAAAALEILGVTAGVAGTPAANLWKVSTSADTTVANPPAITITAATQPTAVTFDTSTTHANARGTWTVGFTSTATGSLRNGDTITVTFPNATSIFSVPATPTILPTKGFNNCSLSAVGAGQTVTITLADNGGTCSVPDSTAATFQILGVTAGAAGTPAANLWQVKTSADTTPGNPAAVTIAAATSVSNVTFSSTTLAANARATWTVNFALSALGNLRSGDTMTITFPNATSVFSVPATPTIIPISGFSHCAATATGSGQTVTITLADSTSSCFIANNTPNVSVQILGVTSGAAGAPAANLWQVSTSNDTTVANPAAPPTIGAATSPTGVTFGSTTTAANARGSWTVGFTPTASGYLQAGDTITIAFPAVTSIFTVPASPSVTLKTGFKNCAVGNATGVGTVVTITLADNGGPCALPNGTPATVEIKGITAGAAGSPTAANWTVKTTADTAAANVGVAPVIGAATTPTAVAFGATTLSANARATWAVGFTTTASGSLRAGDTITIHFPAITSVFTVPASPTVLLTKNFTNCGIASATGAATVVTITLGDSGGVCSVSAGTASSVQILGIVAGAAGAPAAANWTVKTSADTVATNVGVAPVIAAPSSPAAVSFGATTLAANARGTWTVGFTATAAGALQTGDTITIAFPNATSIFTVPASPTVLLTHGFANCSIGSAVGASTTVTITLADSGGICTLPNGAVAQVQILGITAGAAGAPAAANWTVKTSADTAAANVGVAPVIGAATSPAAVNFSATTLAANARGTWTVGFTTTANGSLQAGDTITIAFPNATSIFTVPASPTVLLTHGFANCSIGSAVGASTTVTVTLANNGGVCTLADSAVAQIQVLGVTAGAAGAPAAANWTVKTSADTAAANVGVAPVISAATTPTAVTVGASTLIASRVATWTANFTTSATGSLQTGDTITVAYSAGFNTATATTVQLLGGFSNCSAVVNGVGTVATITLADSGGTCNVGDSTAATFTIAGITNTATTGGSTETVKTSADTTATNAAAVTILAAGTPTAVTVSATTLVAYARATWTVNFTPTATGGLRAGDQITTAFTTGFSIPAIPTVTLVAGFSNCSATATGGVGAVATITLANNGGTCSLTGTTPASLTIAGITNTSPGSSIETVKTSNDSIAANATAVTILAAAAPTAVSFTGSPQTASARSTWTVGFTATSALLNGDTIAVNLPAGFSLPATPTITLTGAGYTSCAATGASSGTTLIVTLSGASCLLTAGQSGAFTVAGVVNPPAATYTNTTFTVGTSADVSAASPAGNVVIAAATTPTAVSYAGSAQTGGARSTWTVGFTSSASGTLRAGDTITLGFGADFSLPSSPSVTLTGAGYTNCSATATTAPTGGAATGPTVTITLANNGGTCSLANSGNGALTIAGVVNPPAQTITAANMTVATSTDTAAGVPAGNVVIAAATSVTAVTFTGSPQTDRARSTWTIGFTTSATGALRAGDTITVGYSARFAIPATPTIALTGAYVNCSATATTANTTSTQAVNSGPTVTITLANSGGTCALANSASGALTIAGVQNVLATTIQTNQLMVKTSADTVAANPGATVTIAVGTSPTAVTFAGSPQKDSTRSTWTVGFTSSGTGMLRAGDTITIAFASGFTIPVTPTITLTGAYTNCSATGATASTSGSGTGPTVTVTLADNGGTCALATGASGALTIGGITNPPAQTITAANLTLMTSTDTVPASPGANVVIAAATAPTAISFAGAPQSANARSTWTIGYTATATGSLRAGDTISVVFAAGFTIPATPTVTLTGAGYTNCAATAVTTGTAGSATGPTVTLTLANNGGNCALANSGNGAFTIVGITNPPAQTITAANLTLATSADTIPASPAGNVVISAATTPTAVSFTGVPQSGYARSTWTIGFTASAGGALKTGDTITLAFANGFSIPATPTITLTGAGYANCSATAVTTGTNGSSSGPTVTVTLANNGGNCALAASGNGALTVAGIANPPAQTITPANLTVATSADTTPASPPGNVVIAAATAPAAVSFTGAPQTGNSRATWTVGYTASASGALKTGDTITIGFAAGYSIPTIPTIALTGAYAGCTATAVTTTTSGSSTGPTVTVTLGGAGCTLANGANGALTIAGIINPPAGTITASNFTVTTSADTATASPASNVVIAPATSPSAVSFTGAPQTGWARGTWTIGYTASASGALKAGDTIVVNFAAGFSIPSNPTIALTGAGYSGCTATATAADTSGSSSGPTVTITLAGAGCALAAGGNGALTIAGVTNPPAQSITAANMSVVTSADTVPGSPGANVVIAPATAPTAVTFTATTRAALALGVTWTAAFTTTAGAPLAAGDTITVAFPSAFTITAAPTITLTGAGYTSCTATGATNGTTVTITLAGASCALAASSAGTLTISGVTNPVAATYAAAGFSVATIKDTAPGSPGASIDIFGPATALTLVPASGTPAAGAADALTLTAVDAGGRTVTTYTGDKSLTFSGANNSTNPATIPTVTDKTAAPVNFGTATTITFTNGVATAGGSMKLYKVESPTVAVSDGTISGNSSLTVSPAAASRLVITGSATQTAGTAQALTITATDPYGNTATTYTGAHSLTFSGANSSTNPVTAPTVTNNAAAAIAFGSPTAITFTNGVATTGGSMKLYKAESATVSATDGTISSAGADRLPVTVSAATDSQLQVTAVPGANVTAATNFSVTFASEDAYGNLANVVGNTAVTLNPSGTGTISGNSGTITAGTNSVTLSTIQYTKAEALTLIAHRTSGDALSDSASSGTITIVAGAFAKLQILMPGETAAPGTGTGKTGAPSAQTAGTSFNVTVNAVDANWNVVNTVTDTAGITSADANAALPANAALVAGTKTFSVTAKTAGTATFTSTDITDGSKTANTSPSTTINAGAFAKLQILMPGETASPGSASGKTGSPSAQTAGTSFNVTVNAVDANWNPVNTITDTVGITSSDANATLPANAALVAGTKTFSVTAKTAGTATFTSTDITDGSKTANTSPSTTINAGAFTKLQILMPGETASPGSASGKTGSPSAQTAGTSFNVTVNAVDANWNVVNTVTDTAGITSTDANAALPANAALVAGTKTFAVTAKTAGSATFTSTDITNGAKTPNTSPATTINAGAFAKLQILMPGETAAPGTGTGKTGAPSAQTAGTSFNVTVNAVDANWNVVNTVTDTAGITSTDANAALPANAALVAGTKTFSVTAKTAGTATFTATDITDGSKTANTSPATTINAGAFAKLQILMPGETASPGSATGKTGSPSAQTAGASFNVTVNAVDANWNPVSATDTVGITSSDANAALPANAALVAGTKTFSVTAKTAGTATFTSTDITDGSKTANTSPATTINAGAFAKLQILMPGETAAPGTGTGKTGSPSAQTAGTSFNVTVNAVDANWNPVSSTDTVGITSSDANAALPANAALVAGTKTFSVTAKTAGSATFTSTDISDGSKTANTSPATTINAGAFAKLQILMPGESASPGSATGKTGSPSAQTAGTSFNVTVNAVDANWNVVNTITDTAGITSTDANAALPANAALVAGTKTFAVTAKTAGTATFTSTDITDGSKTANTSPSTTINAGAFAKLQILMPGETASPGSATGKTGSPSAQTAGTSFNVTVNAVDANWNPVSATDTVALSTSDGNASPPIPAALVAGTKTFAMVLLTAGSSTVTATDQTDGTKTANTSPPTTVNAGAFTKLQILMPGESASPGSATGKTGSPSAQTAGTSFNVTVNAVDANWNVVNTVTDTAGITSTDANAALPANAALVAGTKTFAVTAKTAGTATFTSTDITNGAKSPNTSPSTTINAGAFAKLQILMPGETAAPGTGTGKTGAPSAQTAGASFNVTVNAVDANWNPVSATDTVGITSSDANAALPANAALVAGTKTFSVTAKTAGTRDVHLDRHHQRSQEPEHQPGDDDQRGRVREASDPDARRDGLARQRVGQDRVAVGPDRGHQLQRHRQRRRRKLEPGQRDRHRRHHLE